MFVQLPARLRGQAGQAGHIALRLDKGDLSGAIDDLRTSLANMPENPPEGLVPKVREKLYESLTEYFQKDFDRAGAAVDYGDPEQPVYEE